MNDKEKEIYLRNLICVAKADDVVLFEEDSFIYKVAEEIRANPKIIPQLLEDTKIEEVDLSKLNRLSDRVRCLEDMFELSMTDGEVAQSEKQVLMAAAIGIGIDKDTVPILVMEAKTRNVKNHR